nr:hypothetical protein [Planctomycetota bacterium]
MRSRTMIGAPAFLLAMCLPAAGLDGTWAPGHPMPAPRCDHQGFALPDGSLVVLGGYSSIAPLMHSTSILILDAGMRSWRTGPDVGRGHARGCVLRDGQVLVTGGVSDGMASTRCDLFDPSDGSWSRTADLALPRAYHVCEATPDGGALVIGGRTGDLSGDETWLTSVERFDPAMGTWTTTDDVAMAGAEAAALPAGVIAVGGTTGASIGSARDDGVRIDPSGHVQPIASMGGAYQNMTVTALRDGRALRTGGDIMDSPTSPEVVAAVYDARTDRWQVTAPMAAGRSRHAAVLLGDDSVLVSGGAGTSTSEV